MRKPLRCALTSFLLLLGAFVQAAPVDVFSSSYSDWARSVLLQEAPAPLPGRVADPAQGQTGQDLLDTLHDLTARGFSQHTYQEASRYMFSTADNIQVSGQNGVIDAYSGVFVSGRGGNGSDYPETGDENGDGFPDAGGMNVEHVWPQAFFGKQLPMKSDLHHLLSTFIHPNSVRGQLPFGIVQGRGDYSNKAGAKRGQGFFEPPDAAKGKVARALFYFYTRYHDRNITNGGYNDQDFWNGRIELLLSWNRLFPPDQNELRRNDLVEKFQGNRNPFVDDPSLADRVGVEGFRRGTKIQRLLQRRLRNLRVSSRR